MTNKKIILIQRYIELEEWLEEQKEYNMNDEEMISMFFDKFQSWDDINYLVDAYFVPRKVLTEALEVYDSHKLPFVMNESKFIEDMAEKCGVDRDKIIKRIKQVRQINKLQKPDLEGKKIKKIGK